MPGTDSLIENSPPSNLRALVVDGDEKRREQVTHSLSVKGLRVWGCASVEHGMELFDDHALVVTPLNGDNHAVLEFVAWLRTRAGRIQPYVMGLGEYHAPASEWHGFNEFVSLPLDDGKVHSSVEAARRWHGWNVGVNLLTQPVLAVEDAPLPESAVVPIVPPVGPPAVSAPLPPEPPVELSVPAIVAPVPETEELLEVGHIFAAEEPPPVLPPLHVPAAETFDWTTTPADEVEVETPEEQPAPAETPTADLAPPVASPPKISLSMAPKPPAEMSSNLHQQITEASPFGILLLDDDANLIYANPQHRNILGISVEAAGGLQGWLEQGCVAEPGQQRTMIEAWYEQVWRRRLPLVMTMRSAESLLKEIEFRPSPLAEERLLVAIFDVTDARREEESMRASEARFRNLFLQAPLGVVVVNAVGNVTDASIQFEQLAGCSRLDMRRLGLEQFFSEQDYQLLRKLAFSVRAGAAVAPLAITLKPRHGESVPLQCELRLVKNSQGAPVFTAYYFSSPSPPISMPSPVDDSAKNPLNRLLLAVPDLVLELTGDGKIVSHLPTRDFQDLLPQDHSVEGQSLAKAFPSLAENLPWQEMMQNLEESLDTEVRCEFKYRLLPADAPRLCEARLVQLPAEEGLLALRFGLMIRDLSHQQTTTGSEAPAESYEFSAIEMLRQAAIITNEKGRICNVNPAAEELFGYAKSELLGSGLYQIFLPQQPKEFAQKISEHINRHRCWIGKSSFFRKDGTSGRVAVELVPFTDHGTKGFLGLMRDITEAEPTPAPPAAVPPPANEAPMVTLHRARNDLQVLSSLLSLQANEVGLSETVRNALQESKSRVAAVALVYRLLEGDTGLVDFSKFAAEMAAQVLRVHGVEEGRIRIIPPAHAAKLKQKMAINLGLILQELLTTILLHSFAGEAKGTIQIKLDLGHSEGLLSLKDDGPFHPESVLVDRSKGVGWKVVEALAQQIRGELKILSDLENEIRLRFRLDAGNSSDDL